MSRTSPTNARISPSCDLPTGLEVDDTDVPRPQRGTLECDDTDVQRPQRGTLEYDDVLDYMCPPAGVSGNTITKSANKLSGTLECDDDMIDCFQRPVSYSPAGRVIGGCGSVILGGDRRIQDRDTSLRNWTPRSSALVRRVDETRKHTAEAFQRDERQCDVITTSPVGCDVTRTSPVASDVTRTSPVAYDVTRTSSVLEVDMADRLVIGTPAELSSRGSRGTATVPGSRATAEAQEARGLCSITMTTSSLNSCTERNGKDSISNLARQLEAGIRIEDPPENTLNEEEIEGVADDEDICCFPQQNQDGDTLLHEALIFPQPDSVIEAIIKSHQQSPPSSMISRTGSSLTRRTVLDVCNNLHQTALHLAVITNRPSVVHHLAQRRASICLPDINGDTALHIACVLCFIECARAIIESCRNNKQKINEMMETRNYAGQTCLHVAVQTNNVELVSLLINCLLQSNCDINVQEWLRGRTPLHMAIELGKVAVVEYLKRVPGIDLDARTYDGLLPLDMSLGFNSSSRESSEEEEEEEEEMELSS